MYLLRTIAHGLRSLFHREEASKELDEELGAFLEMATQEKIDQGMSREEALRAVRLERGSLDGAKDEVRAASWEYFVVTCWQDLCFAARLLRKAPGFTAVVVLTLALGLGANTAIFSLVDGLLLRSLPVKNPKELVLLQWNARKAPNYHSTYGYGDCQTEPSGIEPTGCSFSHPFFNDLRSQSTMFSSVTASAGPTELELSGNGSANIVRGFSVSGNYFESLGVRALVGRMIEPSDEEPSASPVAVLSYGYWQRAFGGLPSAAGMIVNLNGVPTTIVGVAEQKFVGLTPGSAPDAWVPLSLKPRLSSHWNPKEDDAGSAWLLIIARLKPEVPRNQAEAAVSFLFHNEMLHGAQSFSAEADAPTVSLMPAQTGLVGARGTYSKPLLILMVAVGIVLFIASANIAGLLLARSRMRQREMALRLALGAGRARIIRQLLTESILLSIVGGTLGVFLAVWGAKVIVAFVASGSDQPIDFQTSVDTRVLLFAAAISLCTGILFGLAPAMRCSKVALTPALKEGVGYVGRSQNHWFNAGNSLVVGQIALTAIVLVGAGLVGRTLQNLRSVDPGFDTSNILNFKISPELSGYKGAQADNLYRNLQSRLNAIPGVTSASYSSVPLLVGWQQGTTFHLHGAPEDSGVSSEFLRVGPEFLTTLRISLQEGRDFSASDFVSTSLSVPTSSPSPGSVEDRASSPQPAIVNETFVRRYLGFVEPLGQRFRHLGADRSDPGYIIVGVVRDAKYTDLRKETLPTTYVPAAKCAFVVFELRIANSPTAVIPAVRNAVKEVDKNLPISNVMTESESIDQLLFRERLIVRLSSFFGVLALALASIGVYGLLSYEVTRRTREIGLRMALGAERSNVLRLVVGQGIALAGVGTLIGAVAAFGLMHYLESLLYGIRPSDPVTFAGVAVVLMVVSLVGCYLPARHATRVDPMVALRQE